MPGAGRVAGRAVVEGFVVAAGLVDAEGLVADGRVAAVFGLRSELVEGRAVEDGLVWAAGRVTFLVVLCDEGFAADDFLVEEEELRADVPDDFLSWDEVLVAVERVSPLLVCAYASDWKAVNAIIVSKAAIVVLIVPIIVLF